jgi:DNA-binding transcriptional ArsR family regulator
MQMTPYQQSTQLFKVLAHPTRLRLLNALRKREECVCHLTALLQARQAYVSQQLMFLRQAGLIDDRKDGARVYYRVRDLRLFKVLDEVNALAGANDAASELQSPLACPCPRCEGKVRHT